MKTKETINSTNILIDLNTTFDDSLSSGFYIIAKKTRGEEKLFLSMTKDGQYSFYFSINNGEIKIIDHRKDVYENYTLDKTIDELQGYFGFEHNYNSVYNYADHDFTKESLNNPKQIEEYIVELNRKETLGEVNDILNQS